MTDLEQIKKAIEALTPPDVWHLREWLEELEGRLFDEAIERDAKSGKLEKFAKQALADSKAGRTRKL